MPMTIPLWSLAFFVAWTIFVVIFLLGVRTRILMSGGSPAEFGVPDDRKLVWRLFRTQANCVENLPLFAAVVLVAAVRGVDSGALDILSLVYMAGRVAQSTIHMAGINPMYRFAMLVVQLLSLVGMLILAVG
jgi:uncharacterized MAPEG superfamily protein